MPHVSMLSIHTAREIAAEINHELKLGSGDALDGEWIQEIAFGQDPDVQYELGALVKKKLTERGYK